MKLNKKLAIIQKDTEDVLKLDFHESGQELTRMILTDDVPFLIKKLKKVIELSQFKPGVKTERWTGYKIALEDLRNILNEQ